MNTSQLLRRNVLLEWLSGLTGILVIVATFSVFNPATAAPIRVVVWDERQDAQKQAYTNHLGDTLAKELETHPEFSVKSVGLNDPDQGLTDEILDNCDVLIWWGHQKHAQVTDEHVKAIIERLKAGKLSLIALHSAHWSKPFVAAMNERAVEDAWKSVPEAERSKVKLVKVPAPGGLAKADAPLTPAFRRFKAADGTDTLEVTLAGCIFP